MNNHYNEKKGKLLNHYLENYSFEQKSKKFFFKNDSSIINYYLLVVEKIAWD